MKTVRLLLLLGAAALQVSCGLPDSYFLQAPTATIQAVSTSTYYQFNNPTHALTGTLDLNVTFQGNELYYRFYTINEAINANAYDPTNPADPSTQLQNAGFLPVRASTDINGSPSIPLISIGTALAAAGSIVTVVISPSAMTNSSNYSVSGGGSAVEIRRDVADAYSGDLNHYKIFAVNANTPGYSPANYYLTDGDMAVDTSPGGMQSQISTGATVYVAMYAVSYGMSISSTPVRSTPAYLGFMQLTNF